MNKVRRKRLSEVLELISQAKDILEEVKDEEQEPLIIFLKVSNTVSVVIRCRNTLIVLMKRIQI